MTPDELMTVRHQLRLDGGDSTSIEVKSAAGGLPSSATASLCALANLPGGGTLILGLSEEDDFAPVELANPQSLKQALGSKARSLVPPANIAISDVEFEGKTVIVALVAECDIALKPCRVSDRGKAFARSYDGDYQLSEQEVQGFLANRGAPQSDRQPVPDTGVNDLDQEVLNAWQESLLINKDSLLRFQGDELLRRAGIMAKDGTLTRAGLLTFGSYPQQHVPRFAIHVTNRLTTRDDQRALNTKFIGGPIPRMLGDTMDWLRQNLPSAITLKPDGTMVDAHQFPLEALRELVANSLVHRDISAWSEGQAIELVLDQGIFAISNPGGLYGITVDRLGREHVTSARNPLLLQLNVNARDPRTGARVVEALSDGLRTVVRLAEEWNLPPVIFQDTGLSFRAVMKDPGHHSNVATSSSDTDEVATRLPRVGTKMHQAYELLGQGGPLSTADVAEALGVSVGTARSLLTRLRRPPYELVELQGGPGKASTYRRR